MLKIIDKVLNKFWYYRNINIWQTEEYFIGRRFTDTHILKLIMYINNKQITDMILKETRQEHNRFINSEEYKKIIKKRNLIPIWN